MSDQRDTILSCACDLFLEEGLEGFTMRRLAGRVGVTAPALYRHYEGREAVLLEVVGEAYRTLRDYLYRALEGTTPVERFARAGRAYLDFALQRPGYYQVLYVSRDVIGLEGLPDEVATHACAIGQFWNDRVRECMDSGILAEADPHEVSVTLWGHAHGLISLYLLGMLDVSEDKFREIYRNSAQRVLRGLSTDEFRTNPPEELGRPAQQTAQQTAQA